LRGFGDSQRSGRYSFEAMRDDVLALVDLIGEERVDLIGHSMGATVAWLVTQKDPDRIAHLVVEDTPPPRRPAAPVSVPRPDGDPGYDWKALEAILAQVNDPDPTWWSNTSTVTVRTLMVAGGPTSPVSEQFFAEAAAMLANGTVVEIPVGHTIHAAA